MYVVTLQKVYVNLLSVSSSVLMLKTMQIYFQNN